MRQETILFPIIAMAVLTLVIAMRVLVLRIRAVKEGGLSPAHFRLNRGGKLPDYLVKAEQHYVNLFESPMLFYVVVIALLVTQRVDLAALVLAWLYVGLRVAHAVVHTTYNNLWHRRNVFLLSVVACYALWFRLLFQLIEI